MRSCPKPRNLDPKPAASIYLFTYLSIYLRTYLSIYLSIYIYIYTPKCQVALRLPENLESTLLTNDLAERSQMVTDKDQKCGFQKNGGPLLGGYSCELGPILLPESPTPESNRIFKPWKNAKARMPHAFPYEGCSSLGCISAPCLQRYLRRRIP